MESEKKKMTVKSGIHRDSIENVRDREEEKI